MCKGALRKVLLTFLDGQDADQIVKAFIAGCTIQDVFQVVVRLAHLSRRWYVFSSDNHVDNEPGLFIC